MFTDVSAYMGADLAAVVSSISAAIIITYISS